MQWSFLIQCTQNSKEINFPDTMQLDISKKEVHEKTKVKCIKQGEHKAINVRGKEDDGSKGNGNRVLSFF